MAAADDGTLDTAERDRFAALAERWWDPDGPMKPLHRINPERLAYLRARVLAHFGRDRRAARALAGLSVLDVGCGAGLLTEPMARQGATVTGIDPAAEAIAAAKRHAQASGLAIDYRAGEAGLLAEAGETFDLVTALEVVEHVPDPGAFLVTLARLVRPGGLLVLSTLSRTLKSFGLAIVGAEYVLRWLPPGTHRFDRFLQPRELQAFAEAAGLRVVDVTGLAYNPLRGGFVLSDDTSVNYFLTATR